MRAAIAYAARTGERPRYYANDHSLDTVVVQPVEMALQDGRVAAPKLDREGFELVGHRSAVRDFTDRSAQQSTYMPEIVELVRGASGADAVIVTSPGVLRFSERSRLAGALNNSMPARFAHIDVSDATAAAFAERAAPAGKTIARFAHYNVWRVTSDPPQDVPLAVCDAASVTSEDLIAADAIFDEPDRPHWSFEGLVVAHNPAHRWHWFPNMTRDEALIFKTNDSATNVAHSVPHVAFDDSSAPDDCSPRSSLEMRAIAYWFA